MKKQIRKKLLTFGLLAAAVIATVEFQKFMQRRSTACQDGACDVPQEMIAAKVTGPQNVPFTAKDIDESTLPQLLDFGAGQCASCKMMDVVLDELARVTDQKLIIRYVDVHEQEELTGKYSIRMIPTQVFLDAQGKELFRHEGFIAADDVLKKWSELGVHL